MAKDKEKFVSGTQEVINNLSVVKHKALIATVRAVERTCVDVMNHAKTGHDTNMAHANQRYRNRTGNLTASIGPPKMLEANFERVHGIVPVGEEHGVFVELGIACNVRTGRPNRPYPFLSPALLISKEKLASRLKQIFSREVGIQQFIRKEGQT